METNVGGSRHQGLAGRRGRLAVLALAVASLASCGGNPATPGLSASSPSSPAAGAVASAPPAPPASYAPGDPAVLAYGAPATRDPSTTYQPDVVFVGGGPSIVRWESADGLTWAIDRTAPGAASLVVGSVMYATSNAIGRVVSLHDDGDSRVVTLMPADLTDLIADGTVTVDHSLDLGSAVYQPLAAGFSSSPSSGPTGSGDPGASPSDNPSSTTGAVSPGGIVEAVHTVQVPTVRLLANAAAPAGGTMPPPIKTCPEVTVSGWGIKPCLEPGKLAVGISAPKDSSGLKFAGTLTLLASDLQVKAKVVISGGSIQHTSAVLYGINGIGISVAAGTADPAKDNTKLRAELPIEICDQIGVIGIVPMRGCFELKVSIETAFSGKNSTLSGQGEYALSGPLGYEDGQTYAPHFSVTHSLMDSLAGITLGPSGLVVATRVKIQVGMGAPGMMAGPYVAFTVSYGTAKASILGAPLADCRTVAVDLSATVGAGLQVDPSKILPFLPPDALSAFKKFSSLKVKVESEVSISVLSKKQTLPANPICGA